MLKHSVLLTAFALLITSQALALGPQDKPEGFTNLEIGDAAPDFSLPGTDGKTYTLNDFNEPDILMILFTGTHCPTSHGIEKRLQKLVEELKDKSFGIVAINPNHNDGLRPDEFGYSLYDESFEDSKRYARDLGWTFPYLYDGDKQLAARAYGCLATPHVFIFDKERKLRYNGRFDDSRFADPDTVKSPDTRNAIFALLEGKPVPVEKTRPHGCSTKWKGRSEHVAKDEAAWQAKPVIIDDMDAELAKKIRQNGSVKLRMINVWATWCPPCVKEMPDLTRIARKFGMRDFEFITISLDAPKDKEKAAAFLGKHRAVMGGRQKRSAEKDGRKTNNYLWTGASTDALAEALDDKWPGPVPYTLLVDNDGNILYRKTGMIDPAEVKKHIMNELTPYWQPRK